MVRVSTNDPSPRADARAALARTSAAQGPLLLVVVLPAVLLLGCSDRDRSSGAPSPGLMPPAAHTIGGDPYAAGIAEERRRKDDYFRVSPDSPVPPSERTGLAPLDYYPIDPSWKMTLPVEIYPKPETFELVTNLGERRVFRREGRVRFEREGQQVGLQLYREIEGTGQPSTTFWVPFADAGAGRETYPAGRYLDIVPNPDGTVTLDFNRAYNPYCAYGWAYSCPMAPPENRLKIAVRAGERGYHRP